MQIANPITPISVPQTRADLPQGTVFEYTNSNAKPGLRMTTETPDGKTGLYAVRLSDGVLMRAKPGSQAATSWPVRVVSGAFVPGYETSN